MEEKKKENSVLDGVAWRRRGDIALIKKSEISTVEIINALFGSGARVICIYNEEEEVSGLL